MCRQHWLERDDFAINIQEDVREPHDTFWMVRKVQQSALEFSSGSMFIGLCNEQFTALNMSVEVDFRD